MARTRRSNLFRLAVATVLAWSAVGLAPKAAPATSPAVYWLDTGPERGPYNDASLRHGHYSPIDTVAGSTFLNLPNYNVSQGLAVDAAEGKVYTNHRSLFTGLRTIRKMNLDGSGVETLHAFVDSTGATQIEFNPGDGKLYLFGGARFFRMNASSSAIAAGGGVNVEEFTLPAFNMGGRGDIDLVSSTLIIQNVNLGSQPFYSVGLDGTNLQPLGATCPNTGCYPGFAADGRSGKIYYARRGDGTDPLGYVYSQNFDGSNKQRVFGPFGANEYINVVSMAIDFDANQLYMASGREGFGGNLSRGALDGSTFEHTVFNSALDFAPGLVALGSVPVPPITDTDGDGVADDEDAFPNDPAETTDTDDDGVGDNGDAFPNDPAETADTDGDGVGDNGDAFPSDPAESVDSDGDGVGNNGDAFPNDPAESADSDGDGVGNNGDAFPNNPAETADSDGDGVGNNGDAFPNNPGESVDSDGDGIGNNADVVDNSNTAPNVSVGGCTIRVTNQLLPNGATFNDLLAQAASGAANHGAYVSAVTQLATTWMKAGLISGNTKGMITSCTAKSK